MKQAAKSSPKPQPPEGGKALNDLLNELRKVRTEKVDLEAAMFSEQKQWYTLTMYGTPRLAELAKLEQKLMKKIKELQNDGRN